MQNEKNYSCKISWVYGINIQGPSRPFISIKKLKNTIMYRISSLTLMLDLDMGVQSTI